MHDKERHNLDTFVEGLRPQEWQVGAVFAIRGQIAGLDVFDSPRTWASLMPKLVRSYGSTRPTAASAATASAEPSPGRFARRRLRTRQSTVYPAVGAGRDLRVEGGGILARPDHRAGRRPRGRVSGGRRRASALATRSSNLASRQ